MNSSFRPRPPVADSPSQPETPNRSVHNLSGTTVGRFTVESRLGTGGMGEVYRAFDTKLKRAVALKRILSSAGEQYRQRVWTEARFASRLSDPRIAAVYDVFEDNGELFLVMEFVEGQTLRRRLDDPLSIMKFLDIGSECVDALVAAHKAGVLHRDIKPENIMLTPVGQVKVLDFGVASRLPNSTSTSTEIDNRSNSKGLSGTLAYMAPEVLEEKQPDERSDIFSLGVIFYEALAGRHPFFAKGFLATCNRIVNEEPAPLRSYNPRVSPELERIVSKMLAKNPAQRYVSAADLLVDLRALRRASDSHAQPSFAIPPTGEGVSVPNKLAARRWWRWAGVATAVLACISAAAYYVNHRGVASAFAARDWLLVSDFENRSGEPLLDDTVAESLGRSLQQSRFVNVVPRPQMVEEARLTGRTDLSHIDSDLGRLICQRENYHALVSGDVEKADAGYQINVKLIDPVQGLPVWKESALLRSPSDLYKSVDELAKHLRAHLGEAAGQIEQQSTPLARVTTPSLEALRRYSAGMKRYTAGDIDGFMTLAKSSLEFDPDFPMAHLNLARGYDTLGNEKEFRAHLGRALKGVGHVSERERYLIQAANYSSQGLEEKALEQYRLLTELYPDDVEGLRGFAKESSFVGHTADAIVAERCLLKIDPHSALEHNRLMIWLVRDNKPSEALGDFATAEAHGVNRPELHWGAGLAYLGLNDPARAREQFAQLSQEGGDYEKNLGAIMSARVLLFEGRLREATEALRNSLLLAEKSHNDAWIPVNRYLLIRTLQLRGRTEEARAEFRKLAATLPLAETEDEELRRAGMLAIEVGDLPTARRMLVTLEKLNENQDNGFTHSAYYNLKGSVDLAEGRRPEAEESQRRATVFQASYEALYALGDIHAANRQWAEAAQDYKRYLDFKGELLADDSPASWVAGHVPLARSLAKSGDLKQSLTYYDEFLSLWGNADADLPLLRQAKEERKHLVNSISAGGPST